MSNNLPGIQVSHHSECIIIVYVDALLLQKQCKYNIYRGIGGMSAQLRFNTL